MNATKLDYQEEKQMDEIERDDIDIERFNQVYRDLVDLTEEPYVYKDRMRSAMLRFGLDLMEWMRGSDDDEPVEHYLKP